MRKLNTLDLFTVSRIYSKMDVKLEITPKTTQTELGVQLVNKFLANIYKAQNEVISFLASLKGVSEKEIEEMGVTELMALVNELFDQEGAKDFLLQAMQ